MDLLTFLRLHRAHKKSRLLNIFFFRIFSCETDTELSNPFALFLRLTYGLLKKKPKIQCWDCFFFFYNSHLYKISFILRIPILHTSRSTVLTFGFKKKDDTLVY